MRIFNKLFGQPSVGRLKAKKDVAGSIRDLEAQDSETRLQAAMELWYNPGEATIAALTKALKDSDPEVGGCAAESLRILGDQRGVEPLIEVLKTDTEYKTVHYAIKELGELGTNRAVEALISALEQRNVDHLSGLAFSQGSFGSEELQMP